MCVYIFSFLKVRSFTRKEIFLSVMCQCVSVDFNCIKDHKKYLYFITVTKNLLKINVIISK